MANIRHTVVVRKDLNMTAGLMSAQVAHISDAFMRERIRDEKEFSNEELSWMEDPYISVLSVDNKEELDAIVKQAMEANINVHVWTDLMYSENLKYALPNVVVGASFGPCDMDRIKAITGNLSLA